MAPPIIPSGKEPKGGTTNWGRKLVHDLKDECISRKIMTTGETLRSYHMAARMSCWEMNLYYEEKDSKWTVLPEYLEIAEMGWHAQRNEDVIKQAQKAGLEDLSGTKSALINRMLRDKRDKLSKEKLRRDTKRANETRQNNKAIMEKNQEKEIQEAERFYIQAHEVERRSRMKKENEKQRGGEKHVESNSCILENRKDSLSPTLPRSSHKVKSSSSSQSYSFNHSFQQQTSPSSLGFSLEPSRQRIRRPSTTSTASTSTLIGDNFHQQQSAEKSNSRSQQSLQELDQIIADLDAKSCAAAMKAKSLCEPYQQAKEQYKQAKQEDNNTRRELLRAIRKRNELEEQEQEQEGEDV